MFLAVMYQSITTRKAAAKVANKEMVILAASILLLSWYFERAYMEEKVNCKKTVR